MFALFSLLLEQIRGEISRAALCILESEFFFLQSFTWQVFISCKSLKFVLISGWVKQCNQFTLYTYTRILCMTINVSRLEKLWNLAYLSGFWIAVNFWYILSDLSHSILIECYSVAKTSDLSPVRLLENEEDYKHLWLKLIENYYLPLRKIQNYSFWTVHFLWKEKKKVRTGFSPFSLCTKCWNWIISCFKNFQSFSMFSILVDIKA